MSDIEQSLHADLAEQTISLANHFAEAHEDADLWDIADELLAGAIHYWLFSRQPCENRACDDCVDVATAERRHARLRALVDELAESSFYYHAPTDHNAAHS